MSNPVFRTGPITLPVTEEVEAYRFVTLGSEGIRHAGSGDTVFGAVSDAGSPEVVRGDNDFRRGNPPEVGVHLNPSVVLIETDSDFELGDTVAAGTDGKAVSGAGAGVVVRAQRGRFVKVLLPAAATTGGNSGSNPGEDNTPGDDNTPSE